MAGVLTADAPSRQVRVSAFVSDATRTAFAPGRRDCLLWLADWLIELGHRDYVAAWRGTYSSIEEMDAILERHGGPIALIEAAHAGALRRVGSAEVGDVGVIRVATPAGPRQVGAIRAGRGWAVLKSSGGVWISARLTPAAVWRG